MKIVISSVCAIILTISALVLIGSYDLIIIHVPGNELSKSNYSVSELIRMSDLGVFAYLISITAICTCISCAIFHKSRIPAFVGVLSHLIKFNLLVCGIVISIKVSLYSMIPSETTDHLISEIGESASVITILLSLNLAAFVLKIVLSVIGRRFANQRLELT